MANDEIFACEGLGNFPRKVFDQKKCPDFWQKKFNGPGLCGQSEAKFERLYELQSSKDILLVFNALSIMKLSA